MLTNKALESIANTSKTIFNKCRYRDANGNYYTTALYNEKVVNTDEYSLIEKNATISASDNNITNINIVDINMNTIDENSVNISANSNEDIVINFKYKFRRV